VTAIGVAGRTSSTCAPAAGGTDSINAIAHEWESFMVGACTLMGGNVAHGANHGYGLRK
jgi:hypothetical protein